MNRRLRNENGQTMVFMAVSIAALLGMSAFVLDVGSWFRADRETQSIADAAALAGAQALPEDAGAARALAREYANDKNSGSVTDADITISTTVMGNDTIQVRAKDQADSFFAKILGFGTIDVGSAAKARSGLPSEAKYVAPIAVDEEYEGLQCVLNPPCSGDQLDLVKLFGNGQGPSGNFTLLDLRYGGNGAPGNSELADWMVNGMPDAMPLGIYEGAPGAKFNSGPFQDALASMYGEEVLLPVYRKPITQQGSGAQYNIVGWVGFVPTGASGGGSSGKVFGNFTRFIAQGLQATGGGGSEDFGVRVVQLVE